MCVLDAERGGEVDAAGAFLLGNLVVTYLPLTDEEREALRVQLEQKGDVTMEATELTWADQISLRARREDIPFLAEHFVKAFSADNGSPVQSVTEAAIKKLTEYHWPGNVRELQNVIERSLVLCSGTTLDAADIKLETAPRPRAQTGEHLLPDGMTLDEYEQSIIREALQRADGNKSQAARFLGLTRNALRYRLAQMGLE